MKTDVSEVRIASIRVTNLITLMMEALRISETWV
jgi:hypothetical protein